MRLTKGAPTRDYIKKFMQQVTMDNKMKIGYLANSNLFVIEQDRRQKLEKI
ncbi:MAG: hypothetical protein LBB19_02200 [Puniceicoccales bacterium]|jgi:hypothetical protein|nr:hypothetical protein [Puniceicoccales bacterium]